MTDHALQRALWDVQERLTVLAERQQGMGLPPISRQAPDDLVTALGHALATMRVLGASYDRALVLAAFSVCLVASVDRAELADPFSGDEAA